jgi:hypothetical protein
VKQLQDGFRKQVTMTDKKIYKVGNVYINIDNITTLSLYGCGIGIKDQILSVNGEILRLDRDEEMIKEANELLERFINNDR